MLDWKRPESVPYPSVWRTFQRKDSSGVEKTYWIQDVNEEFKESFLNIIARGFMTDESICKSLNFIEDSKSVEEYLDLWSFITNQRLCLICLTKNDNGVVEVVGGNGTARSSKGSKFDNFTGKSMVSLISAATFLKDSRDIYSTLNTESYLMSIGLYVVPKFRGQGIAVEILKARRGLCLTVGIDLTAAVFTSSRSQQCAEKAGFKVFSEIAYEELAKKKPDEWYFPGVSKTTKSLKCMYIDYR